MKSGGIVIELDLSTWAVAQQRPTYRSVGRLGAMVSRISQGKARPLDNRGTRVARRIGIIAQGATVEDPAILNPFPV